MSSPAVAGAGAGGPTLRVFGTPYPVLLPTVRDPRLHLAAVIVSLQVLGQVAFEFDLSIAQILVAILTCALLEVGIAFRRQRVILWPASALLTGNGVAFILRVPGTEHGDWWSLNGWWIFVGTAAVALLSKYVIRFRGRHVFNPSNFGLVLSFLLLGVDRADPLEFWWGPMSPWLALALAIIVGGGLAILLRLHLLAIALTFWLTFAACLAVLTLSGHEMTARWHVGPISGAYFWWVLVFSPEILVFLFFMITDPRTVPEGRPGRYAYAAGVGVLASLLIATQTTEFGSKVAVLGALALVCAARPPALLLRPTRFGRRVAGLGGGSHGRPAVGGLALVGAATVAGLIVLAGIPARPSAGPAIAGPDRVPEVTVAAADGVAPVDRATARRIARDVVADLRISADALRRRSRARAPAGATGAWLAVLWQQIEDAEGKAIAVPTYDVERVRLSLEPSGGQGPPIVVAALTGTIEVATYTGVPATLVERGDATRFARTFELALEGNRYLIARARGATVAAAEPTATQALGAVRLADVARSVGLDFRHGAFRFGVSNDAAAMMGGGLCWLDYDADGWLDLFVVNSHAERDLPAWQERGDLPRSALFRNVRGRFEDVSRRSGTDLSARGTGCVAADFDRDGRTDLYVTTAGYDAERDGYDALLWNDGDGTFTEGARAAGINAPGWHAGAAVGDVNGDELPDLFVAGYTDMNRPVAGSDAGFPTTHEGVRDRLYLNQGGGDDGRSTFREVGRQVGIETSVVEHGLGAAFTDVNGDGRLDLYVANDADPNRLYLNVPVAEDAPGPGFELVEVGRPQRVDDPNAGMGIAAADYSGDRRTDLFVTNSRGQLHAAFRSRRPGQTERLFTDARPGFVAALGTRTTGWGVSWADLDLDGDLDLVVAGGAIPITRLTTDARRIQVLDNRGGRFVNVGALAEPDRSPRVNGRGLAAADYDNDGDLDVAVNSIGGPLLLLENTGAAGNWLEVQLAAFSPGAVVTVVLPDGRRLVREVHAGSSYLSSEDPRLHFGLGRVTRVAELLVRWPNGTRTRLEGVAANRILVVDGPSG